MRAVPTLPQRDPHPDRRARALADARGDYAFRYDYHDIVAAVSVPFREKDDVRWWGAVAAATAELKANEIASKLVSGEDYRKAFATIPTPAIVPSWERDDVFAWQALAGANPVMLRRMTRRMDHVRVTEAHYRRAVAGTDTMEAALAEGRLYVADYAVLDGLPVGENGGRVKYNFAPIALYAWQPSLRELVPVAIQCGQSPDSPVFTPADGASWRMARTCVTTAEGNYQGIISHFALCHEVMESVILAARRELAPDHPLLVLLAPHFENTLITNDIAMTNLIGPGGYMERLQSPTLDASLALATRSIADFRLAESSPREDFAARGVDDLEALGEYPARDDALLVWDATVPFLDAYVRLYYTSDADVAGDVELAAWVDAMGATDGGRLVGLTRPRTVADVVALVSRIVWRCTAHHASINYPSYDFFAYAPNMQTAAFAPGPTGGPGDTDAARHAMWPNYDEAYQAVYLFYEIRIQLNRIGKYPALHFADDRVGPLVEAWQARLDDVERVVEGRNTTRKLAYPFLLPSRISASIHV